MHNGMIIEPPRPSKKTTPNAEKEESVEKKQYQRRNDYPFNYWEFGGERGISTRRVHTMAEEKDLRRGHENRETQRRSRRTQTPKYIPPPAPVGVNGDAIRGFEHPEPPGEKRRSESRMRTGIKSSVGIRTALLGSIGIQLQPKPSVYGLEAAGRRSSRFDLPVWSSLRVEESVLSLAEGRRNGKGLGCSTAALRIPSNVECVYGDYGLGPRRETKSQANIGCGSKVGLWSKLRGRAW